MEKKRSLLRDNVEKLSTASVHTHTLRAQQNELKTAETRLLRAEQRVFICQDKLRNLRALLSEARLKYKQKNTPQTKRASETAARKLKLAIQQRHEAVSCFRDLKQIVRNQRAMYKKLGEKSQTASTLAGI